MGAIAKVDTHAAHMERMLHTRDMQSYWAMPVGNCGCLICLLLGKAAFGPGTRDTLGHPTLDLGVGQLTWYCQDSGKSKIAALVRCFGLVRVGGEKLMSILLFHEVLEG